MSKDIVAMSSGLRSICYRRRPTGVYLIPMIPSQRPLEGLALTNWNHVLSTPSIRILRQRNSNGGGGESHTTENASIIEIF
jgi:hypothetical protein